MSSNMDELGGILPIFLFQIRQFDEAALVREELRKLMQSDVFQQAYAELGCPEYVDDFRPKGLAEIKRPIKVVNIHQTLEIHGILTEAVRQGKQHVWEELKADFVTDLLIHLRSNVSYLCDVMYNQEIWYFVRLARHSPSYSRRREALLKLIELDANFLRASFAHRILQQADLESDMQLRKALSRVLDPRQLARSLEKHRQKRALEALLAFGYENRSYKDWADFFRYFNSLPHRQIGLPRERRFWSFENENTVRLAIQRFGIPKVRMKPGRHSRVGVR